MQTERFQKILVLGGIAGSAGGAVISTIWSVSLGLTPILIGGLVGISVAAIGRERIPVASWLVARYRYFEIAIGASGLMMMLFALGIIVVRGLHGAYVDERVIATLVIFLILAVTMILGNGATGATGWMFASGLIGLIAGLTSFAVKEASHTSRAAWGFVALFALAGAWASSRKRLQMHSH